MNRIKELKNWLKYQLNIREKKGYIIGVSGGIDSCVIASILKLSNINFTAYHVVYEKEDLFTKDLCLDYLKNDLKINLEIVNIIKLYNEFVNNFNNQKDTFLYKALNTNIKARFREMLFYNFAKINDYLVIGTINKEEFNLGYFVKNSSIGDILPFADVTKSEIRNMALKMGIPKEIATLKASGCIDKKYAEDEWGIEENQMTDILNNKLNDIPINIISLFIKKRESSIHKREYPPIFMSKR